jgi:stage II sporulation protein GA (sporulation sigma-E factor processing peptidase)
MINDVYVDILFLINFSMDYVCLYVTIKILHRKTKLWRMILASALGGAYSVAAVFIEFSPPIELLTDSILCIAMCFIAFAQKGAPAPRVFLYSFLFLGISMMTGGCMTVIFNYLSRLDLPLDMIPSDDASTYIFAVLAAIAGVISLKSGQLISRTSSVQNCKLKVEFCNHEFEFYALCDSGNLVKDPISHKPVIFVDRKKLEERLDLSFLDDYKNGILQRNSPCKSLRLIVINTATGSSVAVAAMPQSIILYPEAKKRSKNSPAPIQIDALISPTFIAKSDDGYDAIVPLEIIKDI